MTTTEELRMRADNAQNYVIGLAGALAEIGPGASLAMFEDLRRGLAEYQRASDAWLAAMGVPRCGEVQR